MNTFYLLTIDLINRMARILDLEILTEGCMLTIKI
jgi:hypothetical protein